VSQRRACRVIRQPRSTQRYRAQQRNGERALCEQMRELALRHPRFGYRRVHALLRHDGWQINRKRIARLWRQEGLKVPQKQHKRRRLGGGAGDRRRAERINQLWCFDYCHDRTCDGKGLKIFSVIDEFTRRCLAIETQRWISGEEVVTVLKRLMKLHGVPEHVRCDNGPEFIGAAVRQWLARARVAALYITPASPWENGYAESYHARLRDELLSREEFGSLAEAQVLLEDWRREYNQERPHGALGYVTPEAFAAACRRADPDSAALRPDRHDEAEELVKKCCATPGT